MAQVGCTQSGLSTFECFRCTEIVGQQADGVPILEENTYILNHSDASCDDLYGSWPWPQTSCVADFDVYHCSWPDGPGIVDFPRPIQVVAGAHDVELELRSLDVDVDSAPAAADTLLATAIRREIPRFSSRLASLLASFIGDHAEADLGHDPTLFPTCATDQDCRVSSFGTSGMRRNSCVATTAGRRCAGLRFEPRRINVRPDGLEVVFAEDQTGDGQFALLDGRVTLPTGAELCDPARFPAHDIFADDVLVTEAVPATEGELPVCDVSEEGCTVLCPSHGKRCFDVWALTRAVPLGSTCNAGQCCLPDAFCDGACRALDFDRQHCGECGLACDPGEDCLTLCANVT